MWRVKLNTLPPDVYNTTHFTNLLLLHGINSQRRHKHKHTRRWIMNPCFSPRLATVSMTACQPSHKDTHKPLNPVSMQNTRTDQQERGFQQRPTTEGVNDNMQHTELCIFKKQQPLPKQKINPDSVLFALAFWCWKWDTNLTYFENKRSGCWWTVWHKPK